MKIEIHADDYALTPNTSRDILNCIKQGKFDSISIVPNMSCFEECMEMMYEAIPELPFLPLMSVHVNLVEGMPLFKGSEAVPAYGCLSWGKLYMYNWIIGKNSPIRLSVEEEVKAQIIKCQKAIEECIEIAKKSGTSCRQKGLRIDSHQHTHMIPMVWNACIKAGKTVDAKLEYIRNSHEPLMVFLNNKETCSSYRLVNIVKNRILAIHSKKADRLCDELKLDKMYLWGLIMSGNMDINRVSKLYKSVSNLADRKNRTLEILFHPGETLPIEINGELNSEAVITFYLNDGRKNEMDTVMNYRFDRE